MGDDWANSTHLRIPRTAKFVEGNYALLRKLQDAWSVELQPLVEQQPRMELTYRFKVNGAVRWYRGAKASVGFGRSTSPP